MLKLVTKHFNPWHCQQPLWRHIELSRAKASNVPTLHQQQALIRAFEIVREVRQDV